MERFGLIHDKLDIKILILFILQRLPDEIDFERLTDLTMCDEGIIYFDFADCLADLVKSGHVTKNGNNYIITDKGVRNGKAIESSLPYSVRAKAERETLALAATMRRNAMVSASHEISDDGMYYVDLSLSDGVGDVMNIKLLSSGKEQAEMIKRCFRRDAENIYIHMIEYLTRE